MDQKCKMFDIRDKVIIITGAGSGIGYEIAMLFARKGARLGLLSKYEEDINSVTKAAIAVGAQAVGLPVDIAVPSNVEAAIGVITQTYGRLDVLINCAGIFKTGDLESTSCDDWHLVLNTNLNGTYYCMKYAACRMKTNGGGSIINIASEAGLTAIKNQVAYNVSKAAVIALTKSAAVDHAADHIRVNCICPGRILTPLVQKIIDESDNPQDKWKELSHDRPCMHMGTPEEIAAACLAFAADDMKYATGAVLSIDGGYTA